MSLDAVRFIEHAHGHLGWLTAAALVHPAIVLRREARRADLAVGLSTAFVTVTSAMGLWLYVSYRERLKQGIFIESPSMGLLFERKEHLAFGAVILAWAGAAAYVGAMRASPALKKTLRVTAFRAFACAAALSVSVAVLGTIVAVFRSF